MLKVDKKVIGTALAIRLSGVISEHADFQNLIGPLPAELIVNGREVERINSAGIRAWMIYFRDANRKGVRVTLVECSPVLVEQINMISNFTCGAEVESIMLPFVCNQCRMDFVSLFQSTTLSKLGNNLPRGACPKCNGTVVFDDLPEDYFTFLKRS